MRTTPAVTGTVAGDRSFARAPLALSAPGNDAYFLGPADEVGVPQAEGLADPRAGLGQQRQQEAVPNSHRRGEDLYYLLGVECPWRPPRDRQLDRASRDRPAAGDVMQERLVRAAADPAPGHQPRSH